MRRRVRRLTAFCSLVFRHFFLLEDLKLRLFSSFVGYCNNLHQEKNEVILVHANDMPRSNIPYLCMYTCNALSYICYCTMFSVVAILCHLTADFRLLLIQMASHFQRAGKKLSRKVPQNLSTFFEHFLKSAKKEM